MTAYAVNSVPTRSVRVLPPGGGGGVNFGEDEEEDEVEGVDAEGAGVD